MVIEGQRSQPATHIGSKRKCVATRPCAQKSPCHPMHPPRMMMFPVALTRSRACRQRNCTGPFTLRQNYGPTTTFSAKSNMRTPYFIYAGRAQAYKLLGTCIALLTNCLAHPHPSSCPPATTIAAMAVCLKQPAEGAPIDTN